MPGVQGMQQKQRQVRDVRQRAWNAMIVHKTFTTRDIQATARISKTNLAKFLRALAKSGYVRVQRQRQSGKSLGHTVWCLQRNTGPRCPIVRTDGSGVYDPNQERLYPYPEEPADEQQLANGA